MKKIEAWINLSLISWEIEENLSFPIPEFIIFISIVFSLLVSNPAINFTVSDFLMFFNGSAYPILISVALLYAKSYGEPISNGKIKLLLSYPVRRREVFFAKYLTNFIFLLLTFGSILFFNAYLTQIDTFSVILISFAALVIVIFLLSTVATFISLAIKSNALSAITIFAIFFGIDSIARSLDKPYNIIFSLTQGGYNIAKYIISQQNVGLQLLGKEISESVFMTILALNTGIAITAFIVSFVYFVYFLEVD